MAKTLYETDIPVWSERQADLLCRLATGERVNADVDWDNVTAAVPSRRYGVAKDISVPERLAELGATHGE